MLFLAKCQLSMQSTHSNTPSDKVSVIHTKYFCTFHSNALSGVASTIQADYLCNYCMDTTYGVASTIHKV